MYLVRTIFRAKDTALFGASEIKGSYYSSIMKRGAESPRRLAEIYWLYLREQFYKSYIAQRPITVNDFKRNRTENRVRLIVP